MSRKHKTASAFPKVDKGIPIAPHANKKYPFPDMEIGDSFWSAEPRIRQAAYNHGVRRGIKFVGRTEGTGIRIWRVK